jgi:hypothetical protein
MVRQQAQLGLPPAKEEAKKRGKGWWRFLRRDRCTTI